MSCTWFESTSVTCADRCRLTRNILAFHRYIIPNKAEIAARNAAIKDLFTILRRRRRGNKLRWEVFGSSKSGILTADADIDIRAFAPGSEDDVYPPSLYAQAKVVRFLEGCGKCLDRLGGKGGFTRIAGRYSRYPLLDVRHHGSACAMQVVGANSSRRAQKSVEQFRGSLKSLGPLYSVVRTMLKVRGLTNVYRGGLSSYPLIGMITASLLLRPGRSLGEDLLNFLRLYSTLDTATKVVSLTPPGIHDRGALRGAADADGRQKSDRGALRELAAASERAGLGFMLCLQDPADRTNDLGRKAFAWRHVAATMAHALRRLRRLARLCDDGRAPAFLLGELVGPCARMLAWRRRAARRFGRALLPRPEPAPAVGRVARERGMRRVVASRRRLGIQKGWTGRKTGRAGPSKPLVRRRWFPALEERRKAGQPRPLS
jgi:non-canonical poly(A) RNA polymerase PAPD5/7